MLRYERPQDMVEPITLDAYEARLLDVLNGIQADTLIVRVPFDRLAYDQWRGARADTHQARAEWINQLDLS